LISLNATLGSDRHDNVSLSPPESGRNILVGELRLLLYKTVAEVSGCEGWPLWIPTPARVLVSCNICSEPVSAECDADRFIVNGFLKSITKQLAEPFSSMVDTQKESVAMEDTVSLSLFDARIWVGACARLPREERYTNLEKALDVTNTAMNRILTRQSALTQETAMFLARLVTTILHLATVTGCTEEYGKALRQALSDMSSRQLTVWSPTNKQVAHVNFSGLLYNPESTDLYSGIRSIGAFSSSLFSKFQEMFVTTMTLGFQSIKFDHGHLLYAAWNAHGRSSIWNPQKDELAITSLSILNPAAAILAIRSDMCLLHRQIRRDRGGVAKTAVATALDAASPVASPRTIIENLKVLIKMGNENIHKVIDSQAEKSENVVSVETCALVQSLCVCVSFGISMLTSTDSNYFAEILKHETEMSKSPEHTAGTVGEADCEMDSYCSSDALMNSSERLSEVCRSLGAIPGHPDWLDTSCQLRYGISRSEARELAASTMSSLTKIVKSGLQLRTLSANRYLTEIGRTKTAAQLFVQSTSMLFSLSNDANAHNNVLSSISDLCSVPKEISKCLVGGIDFALQGSASDLWCPNASQQVVGEMQTLVQNELLLPSEVTAAELRATGDWELAQALSLLSGVCDPREDTDRRFVESSRWTEMAGLALEWMVPACALLRFTSVSSTPSHPLKSPACSIHDYRARLDDSPEVTSIPVSVASSIRESAIEVLHLVARPHLCEENVSQTLATHILGAPGREFRKLALSGKLVSFAQIMGLLIELRSSHSASLTDLRCVASDIIRSLKGSDISTSHEWLFTRLLIACAHGIKVDINSLLLGRFKAVDIIFSELSSWANGSSTIHLSSFVLETMSLLTEVIKAGETMPKDVVQFCASILASISIVERREKMEPKLSRMIHQNVAASPSLLFETLGSTEGPADSTMLLHHLANICAIPFFSRITTGLSKFVTLLSGRLDGIAMAISTGKTPSGILNLWFLCTTYSLNLDHIGDIILASERDEQDKAWLCYIYMSFVSDLTSAASGKLQGGVAADGNRENNTRDICTFVASEGYNNQHWYFCRTCGLTGEKGCCSVCARVCHQGHDITYSRYGPFFCDCGSARSDSALRKCQCLSPVKRDALSSLPEDPPDDFFGSPNDISDLSACTELAVSFFGDKVQKALKRVCVAVSRNQWIQKLSLSVRSDIAQLNQAKQKFAAAPSLVPATVSEEAACCGEWENSFDLVSRSKAGVFKTLSGSVEGLADRCLLVSDHRGRLVVSEGSALRFLAISNMMDQSFSDHPGCFSRADIQFFASVSHDVSGVCGMQLSSFNNHHLVLWSQKVACIYAINDTWTGVTSQLKLRKPNEPGGLIIKCGFLPGVDGFVFTASKDSFTVYRMTEDQLSPVVQLALPTSSIHFKNFEVIPIYRGYNILSWKVVCLTQNGCLRESCFTVDDLFGSNEADTCFESNSITLDEVSSDDFVDRIDYLEHSSLLIVQLLKAGTVSVQIESGKLVCTIPLLSRNLLTVANTSIQITGPYSHWHSYETHDIISGSTVLSLLSYGKIVGTSDSVLISFAVGSQTSLKFTRLTGSVEGSVLCTLPVLTRNMKPFDKSIQRTVSERLVLCSISSGCLMNMIEPGSDINSLSRTPDRAGPFVFENLIKVPQPDAFFHVHGMRYVAKRVRLVLY
jgi:hypothetical protein